MSHVNSHSIRETGDWSPVRYDGMMQFLYGLAFNCHSLTTTGTDAERIMAIPDIIVNNVHLLSFS